MNYTCIMFGLMFIIAGIVFAFGKVYRNISAWKSMSVEEKSKIKIIPLCRNIGMHISLSGMVFLMKGLFNNTFGKFFVVAMIIWLIIAGLDVFYISKSNRYINK